MSDQDKTRVGAGPQPAPSTVAANPGSGPHKAPEVIRQPSEPTVIGGMAQPPLRGRTMVGVAANQLGLNPHPVHRDPKPPAVIPDHTQPMGAGSTVAPPQAATQPQPSTPPPASTM